MKKTLFVFLSLGIFILLLGMFATPFTLKTHAKGPAKQECTTIQSGSLTTSDLTILTTGYDKWGYNYQAKIFNGKYCDSYRDAPWCQPYKEDNLIMKWNDAWLSNVDCDNDGLLDRHFGYSSYIGSGAWLTNHQSGSYEDPEYKIYTFVQKDPSTWIPILGGATGEMIYGESDFEFSASGLTPTLSYGLVYYPDPWPGTGCMLLGSGISDTMGKLSLSGDFDFSIMPPNFKIWLVPTTDFSCPTGFTVWNPSTYLFENGTQPLIQYWTYFVKIVAAPESATKDSGNWVLDDGSIMGPVIWGEFAVIQEIYNDTGTGNHGVLHKGETPTGFGFYRP